MKVKVLPPVDIPKEISEMRNLIARSTLKSLC